MSRVLRPTSTLYKDVLIWNVEEHGLLCHTHIKANGGKFVDHRLLLKGWNEKDIEAQEGASMMPKMIKWCICEGQPYMVLLTEG
jgi:hypothetical protein